ncbi:ABC transporter ATP-binding protein [Desulfonema ishimotonii]|uniref:ABC transporter ATP-binding protein n=1 Tax=Desulfonema ishimotonii TaxID=45657 RepID=A0A401G153_9BACT|nr:ABC transporter ATP-binding protein [Desulfonema ishimotonii]GBC62940.1 ABC transporter ATP-binding protein [Desulfonema ishimotonii]
MALLEISDIFKAFDGQAALRAVSLTLEQGHILCLLGPSGCGKTTLLRIIAGLERPDRGRVVFDGADMTAVPPHCRNFGMMFQEYALFPHKNVAGNVAFGLEMQNKTPPEIAARVREMLELVGLSGFEHRDIGQLSGGERQRVALARSLAPQPRLLMLDEPMGALDRALREWLMPELRRILKNVGVTAIFVTHDHAEAFAVADRIAVFDRGRIQQIARPETLYSQPATPAVARFLGFHNLLEGRAVSAERVETPVGYFNADGKKFRIGENVTVLLRPEGVRPVSLADAPACEDKMKICGIVREAIFQGPFYRLSLYTETGHELVFHLPCGMPLPSPGDRIVLEPDPSAVVFL